MAYTINLTDGTLFATVVDGTVNTDSTLTMIGKNVASYGEFLDENYIRLLESGANTVAPTPTTLLAGQLWFDKTIGVLKVYNGTLFKNLGAATSQSTEPVGAVLGDMWFDTDIEQLFVYQGTSFVLVGPISEAGTGISGPSAITILDTPGSNPHVIVRHWVNNEIVGITSNDALFTPAVAITGFATISPGYNLSTTLFGGTPEFIGTATNADLLDTLDSTQFLRSDVATANTVSLTVGPASDVTIGESAGEVFILQNVTNGNILLRASPGGVPTTVITINGTSGKAEVADPALDAEIANQGWVNTQITTLALQADGSVTIDATQAPTLTDTVDLGTTILRFNSIYANNFQVGVNATLTDIAATNTTGLNGLTDPTKGFVKFGSLGAVVGCNGTTALTVDGNTVWHTGNDGVLVEETDYATSTVGGTLKARLSGTTLYLTNDGTTA